ncbi:SGNH/GDSL hydrolase family protein [Reichenbachiella sp. MSK19-1]|uniref:SGNH/GDSL hydrolase family protein n=1 Tax=Reichenbachiella sp. MSK19-1 TaxID=1897631 RepID=UPI000E6BE2BD|nr:SGNH/GDSL hydrolase family protein [Reichenbachiella sp. MSK19-1]RJE74326.1 electron transporter RnfD [Reichenbachiella sp. MSK19-1]
MNQWKALLFLISITTLSACSDPQPIVLEFSNGEIDYSGRIDSTSGVAADLYWSGTSIKLDFEGESISALMQDERGDNYYNVIIDEDSMYVLRPDTTKKYYQLASGLSGGKHSVELFKRTEWDRGKTIFYGLKIEGDAKVLPKSREEKKKIEFYGNSITAGYAVDDFSGKDRSDSIFTNHYLSYAAITARHYDAERHTICKSGIGITISWFPMIMPEIYDRINPEDPSSSWDFSLYTPDLVVINLLQNDSWLVNMPEREEFKTNFGDTAPTDEYLTQAYQGFVSQIRGHYPSASIICMLGNMDATQEGSKWPGVVESAVDALQDENIYTYFQPFKNTSGHPSIEEQQIMADGLIQFIDENITW